MQELDPISFDTGLNDYADGEYDEEQDSALLNLYAELEELGVQLEDLISYCVEEYLTNLYKDSPNVNYEEFIRDQYEFYKKHESHICDCFFDTSEFGEIQNDVEKAIINFVYTWIDGK